MKTSAPRIYEKQFERELEEEQNSVITNQLGVITMEKITLTVNEVAKFIGVSTATIYTMTRLNEIPHKKIRGKILFHKETIEKWFTDETV